jgi:hypothetical protein
MHSAFKPLHAKLGSGAAVTLAAMAAMALYNFYRVKQSERLHPPRGRFVTVKGVRLHYLEAGTGPAVILLHGNVVTAEDFEASGLLALLAQRYRVLAAGGAG